MIAQTTISSTEQKVVNNVAAPSFVLDFGGRVRQLDPLQLFTLQGTDRKDVVYDVQNGKVYITAYVPNPAQQTTFRWDP